MKDRQTVETKGTPMRRLLLASTFLAGMAICQMASAVTTYSFELIGDPPHETDLSGQLFVDVSGVSWTAGSVTHNGVLFNVRNVGPTASVIKGVYFDDGTLLGLSGLIDKDQNFLGSPYVGDSKVDFTALGSPGDLPGGNTLSVPFVTSAGFYATADSPAGANKNGIDPTEQLGIVFELQAGKNLDDVLKSLDGVYAHAAGEPALRIGLHVGSIAPGGGSDSYVNVPNNVPDGGTTAALLGVGLVGIGFLARRKA